jgi:hypothetical protein
MNAPAPTVRALVAGVVDYAGLFPPASLSMTETVENYARYLAGPDAWMLGRLVVAVSRLGELATEAERVTTARGRPWRVAAIGSGNPSADGVVVRDFNTANHGRLTIDVIEQRAASAELISDAAAATPSGVTLYAELPLAREPRPLLEAAKRAGARAKARTGGVVADAFPSASELARFIVRCAELSVSFKATAGLHHPVRSEHPLTYLDDAPRSTMFGFLGVFAAAAFARSGMEEQEVMQLLEERDVASFIFDDRSLRWRQHAISLHELEETRASFAIAFGSCSFREPVDDLRQLHLIQ